MVAANGYLEYMGAREFQVVDKLDAVADPQPELTRSEYLRLLSTARSLEREQVYLLVKLLGAPNSRPLSPASGAPPSNCAVFSFQLF